jgi:hypothetical protein
MEMQSDWLTVQEAVGYLVDLSTRHEYYWTESKRKK